MDPFRQFASNFINDFISSPTAPSRISLCLSFNGFSKEQQIVVLEYQFIVVLYQVPHTLNILRDPL